MFNEILRDSDRAVAIAVKSIGGDRIQIGVLFVEAHTSSPLQLGQYTIELPPDLCDQPVPRVATELEFNLLRLTD